MAKCEDCEKPIVWLRKPGGGWLPPVEPVFDFAYNDHFTATVDGTAQPVPQIYKRHECLTWEERQLKLVEREQEKQALIEADRARRAEEQRLARELEEAREAQEEEERQARRAVAEAEREKRETTRRRAAATRLRKEAEKQARLAPARFKPTRLLTIPCRDCGAEVGESCRFLPEEARDQRHPDSWWKTNACNSRYADGPPDDRSRIHHVERWGEDGDPWPPADNDPGRYEMRNWLRHNYLDVFEPEKRWLTDEEQRTLSDWLANFGDLFEEVRNGPEDVDAGCGIASPEGDGRGHAKRALGLEAAGDRVDPEGSGGPGEGDGEHADREEGQ